MKKIFFYTLIFSLLFFTACQSTNVSNQNSQSTTTPVNLDQPCQRDYSTKKNQLTLLFAGDLMAHNVNYRISTYDKIWKDIKPFLITSDMAFANIEAPVDTTKSASSYPNFNMTKKYIKASINAGFNVFSLCNNHTNDQLKEGITETSKTVEALTKEGFEQNNPVYFSGLKSKPEDELSYNLIKANGWNIIFLPITELLNRPAASDYINFVPPEETERKKLFNYIKKLNSENPNDLFIISIHTAEPEYTRVITDDQENFYKDLLDCGVDVIWANHPHIIKDRKYIFNPADNIQKVIMYANGNIISGQRTKPDFTAKNPIGERDNTGDGLMVQLTFTKNPDGKKANLKASKNIFITTYINTANEYTVKTMDNDFINYLKEIPRNDWADYIEKRIKINKDYTKDLIEWQ